MGKKLFVKNMVCDRCKMVVNTELEQIGLHPVSTELGVIELSETTLSDKQTDDARQRLTAVGFELIEDRKSQIIDAVKSAVIDLVHRLNDDTRLKHSEYLSQQTGLDYTYLSKAFSEDEGTTIEQYIILQKIEKVKELLTYDELTLSEISYRLGYSSVAALSSQFKKVVGVTPSAWKAGETPDRKSLDSVGRS